MPRKKWSDLTGGQKRAVFISGAAETVITVAALRDLAHRPGDGIRGSKTFWLVSFVVQPFGPIAYLAAARK
jgi:hypothetical protein